MMTQSSIGGPAVDRIMRDIQVQILNINTLAAGLDPLIQRTSHLSMNSVIRSCKLDHEGETLMSIVAKLNEVSEQLRQLILEMQQHFLSTSINLASYVRSKSFLSTYWRALEHVNDEEPRTYDDLQKHFLNPQNIQALNRRLKTSEPGSIQALLIKNVRDNAQTMHDSLKQTHDVSLHLENILDRQLTTAIRTIRFIATTLRIETAKIEDTSTGIETISTEITGLAEHLDGISVSIGEGLETLENQFQQLGRIGWSPV